MKNVTLENLFKRAKSLGYEKVELHLLPGDMLDFEIAKLQLQTEGILAEKDYSFTYISSDAIAAFVAYTSKRP